MELTNFSSDSRRESVKYIERGAEGGRERGGERKRERWKRRDGSAEKEKRETETKFLRDYY